MKYDENKQIQIVGAGVAGLCLATELASRDETDSMNIEIIDKASSPSAASCSWWAGGMLAPFCEAENTEPTVARLGQMAKKWWQQHTDQVHENGTLVLAQARDQSALRQFSRRTQSHEWLDNAQIETLEPDLAEKHQQGLYFPSEAHLNPRIALQQLADKLQKKGIKLKQRHYSTDISASSHRKTETQIIDCRGLSASDALKDLRGVKGEMLNLHCPDITLSRPIRLLHPRYPIYIVPRGNHNYMLGATMIESSSRQGVTARSLLELLSAAYALHPAFAEAEVREIGVDARPAFEDNLPRITQHNQTKNQTIYLNGLYRHGFLLAPALASMTADWLIHQTQPELLL